MKANRLRHRGRAPARPRGLPRRRPGRARAGSRSCSATRRSGAARRRAGVVALGAGRVLAPARRAGIDAATARGPPPVTHVAYADAEAYAAWAGKELPSEAEWERAARGGLDGTVYAWGDEHSPQADASWPTLAGPLPVGEPAVRTAASGTSPVASVPAQRLRALRHGRQRVGVDGRLLHRGHDADAPRRAACRTTPGCAPRRQRLPARRGPPRKVIKGGSHLCAPNYCLRYRPAARQGESVDTSTTHIGFRCVVRAPGPDAA